MEPPFWWVGMENSQLQLLVKGESIGTTTAVELNNAQGVSVKEIHKADSPDYLFIDLQIDEHAEPGTIELAFRKGKKTVASYQYQLKERTISPTEGIDNSDVIYLITPDRFANGDQTNDSVDHLEDKLNRQHYNGRHGGDLQGIISRLDYMQELGVTALWLNPVLENAMPEVSYHGYAITDYYQVDPRYGSNALYKQLAAELKKRDMKLIMDMVFNHSGVEHWWMSEPPFDDWIHHHPEHKITNHAMASISDPYGVESERALMETGWFVSVMPDLNHNNPFMETYLIQNSIWWIEYAGLDGIRMDTYPYNNKQTMQRWADRVLSEYPDFYLVGEVWIGSEAQEAYWAPQAPGAEYHSGLTSITDFPLCNAIHAAFKADGDVRSLYDVLSKDFLYAQPDANKIFADNHDMDRFFHTIGEDVGRFKNAMTFLLTTRGIPQLYYGTEILMSKFGEHGVLREDFPGGWEEDLRDAFSPEGRTTPENEAFDHLKKLLNWRKTSAAVTEGGLRHYAPYDNIYVYSRSHDDETIVVLINNNAKEMTLNLARYHEILAGSPSGYDVLTGAQVLLEDELLLPANESLVLKLAQKENN